MAPDADTQALLALLASCTDREKRRVTELDWQAALDAPGTRQIALEELRTLTTLASGELRLDAALLVISPDSAKPRMLARLGDTIYSAFTRCDPELYAALLSSEKLEDDAAR